MKSTFTLLLFSLLMRTDKLVLFDFDCKKPPTIINAFDQEFFLGGKFVVHYADLPVVEQVIDAAAKQIYKGMVCDQPVYYDAGHSSIRIKPSCEEGLVFSIQMTTRINDAQYSFTLVHEKDGRKAQMQLLDFIDYLKQVKEL